MGKRNLNKGKTLHEKVKSKSSKKEKKGLNDWHQKRGERAD